jgi:hypothetical protein
MVDNWFPDTVLPSLEPTMKPLSTYAREDPESFWGSVSDMAGIHSMWRTFFSSLS